MLTFLRSLFSIFCWYASILLYSNFYLFIHQPQRSGTQQTLEESPTEFFPICLSNYIQQHRNEDVLLALLDYLAPLVVASSGVIAVVPDTLGYGESHQYNRTYLLQDPSVAQAWTVSYLAAQQYIRNVTGGCTALASTTAVGGYGHGGYEAVLAAQGLEKLGISVFQLYVGGAVLNLPRQMGFLLQQLKSTATTTTNSDGIRSSSRNKYLESMTWMWAFSYSQQIGGVSLPSLASVGWRARILQLSAPNPEVPILYSNENLLDIIHPDIVDFFEVLCRKLNVYYQDVVVRPSHYYRCVLVVVPI
jgi:hypothetical protein